MIPHAYLIVTDYVACVKYFIILYTCIHLIYSNDSYFTNHFKEGMMIAGPDKMDIFVVLTLHVLNHDH